MKRVLLPVLGLVLLASACGGSSGGSPSGASPSPMSAAAYKAALANVARQENQAQQSVGAALHAKSVAAIRTAVSTFAKDQQHVSTELSALDPPANAVQANAALAAAFAANAQATQAVLSRLAHAGTAKQAIAVLMHASGPQKSGQQIDQALAKLKALGYTAGS